MDIWGCLPQNPQSHFSQKDGAGRPVLRDRWQKRKNISGISDKYEEGKGNRGNRQSDTYWKDLLERHPYDLSGGEQQRLALAKVLLLQTEDSFDG